jgi:hypothetical protein
VLVKPNPAGKYEIPLNYSQAVYCKTAQQNSYTLFPRMSAASGAAHLYFCLALLLGCLLL